MRIGRVNIESVTEASTQTMKILQGSGVLGEEFVDRAYFGQAGFSHLPKEDDIGIMVKDGNSIVVIASESPDRPLLSNEGDTVMYASETVYIKITNAGVVLIDNGSGTIELKANGQVDINDGNLTVDP